MLNVSVVDFNETISDHLANAFSKTNSWHHRRNERVLMAKDSVLGAKAQDSAVTYFLSACWHQEQNLTRFSIGRPGPGQ